MNASSPPSTRSRFIGQSGCGPALRCSLLLWALLSSLPVRADHPLTLERALALARSQAPIAASLEAEVDEARARLRGASVILDANPVLETQSGPRWSPDGTTLDVGVRVSQEFEWGGRRAARIRSAESGLRGAQASADDAMQDHLRRTAVAFLEALHAERSAALSRVGQTLGEELVRVTLRRRDAGEASELDVHRARMELARTQAELYAARITREEAVATLRVLIGLPLDAELRMTGELTPPPPEPLDQLMERAMAHPALAVLEARAEEADAERAVAEGSRWPGIGVGVGYVREADEQFAQASLALTLPVFNREQGRRGEAIVRGRRLRAELQARKRALAIQVQTAFVVHGLCLEAMAAFEEGLLDTFDGLQERTKRAYESGQLSLSDVLTLRREMLETRRRHLDRQLEAAISGVELAAISGGLR